MDGCAREDEAVTGRELFNGAGNLGLSIFYDVTLVQDAVVPVDRGEKVDIVPTRGTISLI